MTDNNKSVLFSKYLNNELTENEENELLELLKNDQELVDELYSLSHVDTIIMNEIGNLDIEKRRIKAISNIIHSNKSNVKWKMIFSIAALVIVILSITFVYLPQENPKVEKIVNVPVEKDSKDIVALIVSPDKSINIVRKGTKIKSESVDSLQNGDVINNIKGVSCLIFKQGKLFIGPNSKVIVMKDHNLDKKRIKCESGFIKFMSFDDSDVFELQTKYGNISSKGSQYECNVELLSKKIGNRILEHMNIKVEKGTLIVQNKIEKFELKKDDQAKIFKDLKSQKFIAKKEVGPQETVKITPPQENSSSPSPLVVFDDFIIPEKLQNCVDKISIDWDQFQSSSSDNRDKLINQLRSIIKK